MNLEDLKKTWNEESLEEIPEVSLSEQKELRQPLSIIRKNMKMEFWSTVVLILAMVIGVFFWIKNTKLLIYTETLLGMMILVCTYYFWKFKKLYQEIEKPNYSTFQSLLELNYTLKYYTDLYVSYYVAFVPFLFCEFLLMYEFNERYTHFQSENLLLLFVFSLLIGILTLYFFGKAFFNAYYGRYIAEVANLLKKIKHPYEDFENQIVNVDGKIYWYSKMETFFIRHLGKMIGRMVNLIFWLFIMMVIVFLIGFLVGYLYVKINLI